MITIVTMRKAHPVALSAISPRIMHGRCTTRHVATAPIHGNVILSENGSKRFAAKYTFVTMQIQGEYRGSALRFSRSTLRTFTGNLRDNRMEMYATGCFRAVTNSRHVSPCVCMCVHEATSHSR